MIGSPEILIFSPKIVFPEKKINLRRGILLILPGHGAPFNITETVTFWLLRNMRLGEATNVMIGFKGKLGPWV